AFGGLYPDGQSPTFYAGVLWPKWNIARCAALLPDASGGYGLGGYGGLHPFGYAPAGLGGSHFPNFDLALTVAWHPGEAGPAGCSMDWEAFMPSSERRRFPQAGTGRTAMSPNNS